MGQIVVTGIVTRYVNYKDNDRMLTIFTQEQGRLDVRAPGCRRVKSPLLSCSQPFVFGEFQVYEGKGRYSVNQCDVRETFYPIREDFQKLQVGAAMLSLTQGIIQEQEQHTALFSLLYHSLSFLSYTQCAPMDLMLAFLLRFLQVAGVCPAITACAACGEDLRRQRGIRFSAPLGGAVCARCAAGRNVPEVSTLALEAMRRILQLEDAHLLRVVLPPAVQRELYRLLCAYCEHHLERENKQLKALQALLPAEA